MKTSSNQNTKPHVERTVAPQVSAEQQRRERAIRQLQSAMTLTTERANLVNSAELDADNGVGTTKVDKIALIGNNDQLAVEFQSVYRVDSVNEKLIPGMVTYMQLAGKTLYSSGGESLINTITIEPVNNGEDLELIAKSGNAIFGHVDTRESPDEAAVQQCIDTIDNVINEVFPQVPPFSSNGGK